jgi:Ni/Co efflux regulator RcnB
MNSRFTLTALAAAALWAGMLPAFAQGRVRDRNASNNPEIYQQTHPEDLSNPQLQGTPRQLDRSEPSRRDQDRGDAHRRDNERRQPDRGNSDRRGSDHRRDYGYVAPRPNFSYNRPPAYYSPAPVYYGAPSVYYDYGAVPQTYYPNAAAPMVFRPGDYLPPEYFSEQFVVQDWQWRGLSAPPYGYRWIVLGPDNYALVAEATGQVVSLVAAR